jgi:hypothetical protein
VKDKIIAGCFRKTADKIYTIYGNYDDLITVPFHGCEIAKDGVLSVKNAK